MELLFVPQILSALVVVPCAVVWGRDRERFAEVVRGANRHFALWAWVSDELPPERAAAELVKAFGPLAKLAALVAEYHMQEGDR